MAPKNSPSVMVTSTIFVSTLTCMAGKLRKKPRFVKINQRRTSLQICARAGDKTEAKSPRR